MQVYFFVTTTIIVILLGVGAVKSQQFVPFQIARPSADHRNLEPVFAGLERLAKIREKISIVGITGGYHSGKSFLLNSLVSAWHGSAEKKMGDARANFFEVATHVAPKTLGIWLLETDVMLPDGSRLILCDSEGLYSLNVDSSYDAKIFIVVALASSTLIYNVNQVINQEQIEYLEILARRAHLYLVKNAIRSASPPGNTGTAVVSAATTSLEFERLVQDGAHVEFPSLVVVVEDFVQDLQGLSAQQWLDQYVDGRRDRSSDAVVTAASLRDVFPKGISCHTLFLPSTDVDNLKHLGTVDTQALTTRYVDDVVALRDALHKKTSAKAPPGGSMLMPDGRMAAALFRFLLAHINLDAFPQVPSLWHEWLSDLKQHAESEIVQFYQERMSSFLSSQPPRSQTERMQKHEAVVDQALAFFRNMLFDVETLYGSSLNGLRGTIEQHNQRFIGKNAEAIERHIEATTRDLLLRATSSSTTGNTGGGGGGPVDPAIISRSAEVLLVQLGSEYASTLRVYKSTPPAENDPYERHRRALVDGIESIFAKLIAVNEQKITEFFVGAKAACTQAFEEHTSTTHENSGTPTGMTTEEISRVIDAASRSCDLAVDVFVKTRLTTTTDEQPSMAWLEKTPSFASFQKDTEKIKKQMGDALQKKNTEVVCALADRTVRAAVKDAKKEIIAIGPLPDEPDVIVQKCQAVETETLAKLSDKLSRYEGFTCDRKSLGWIHSELAAARQDKISQNVETLKALEFHVLDNCARVRVETRSCGTLCGVVPYLYRRWATDIAMQCFAEDAKDKRFSESLRQQVVDRWLDTNMASHVATVTLNGWLVFLGTCFVGFVVVWVAFCFPTKNDRRNSNGVSLNGHRR
jgi:hypothetical protein